MTNPNFITTLEAQLQKFSSWQVQLCLLGGVLLAADFLLFQGEHFGITLPMFFLLLGLVSFASRWQRRVPSNWKIGIPVLFAGLLPLVEVLNTMTATVGLLATIASITIMNGHGARTPLRMIERMALVFVTIPKRFIKDNASLKRLRNSRKPTAAKKTLITYWILPIAMTLGFLGLFSIANPLIGGWLANIDFLYPLRLLNFNRILFWFAMMVVCWPLIRVRLTKLKTKNEKPLKKINQEEVQAGRRFFDTAQILRALLLFNLLFAIQTVLDITYLWGSGELPPGVSHSQYVHRGTYILLFTALLAAAFILYVTAKKSETRKSVAIYFLLLAWTAQNIFLVVSTMKRMELYVEAYALTYLRVAALVWMFLVFVGLCLIIVQLIKKHSNNWLISANLISLALTLYIISFANMPHLIASYNVNTALENSNKILDFNYLGQLGENAMPAIDKVLRHVVQLPKNGKNKISYLPAANTLASKRNYIVRQAKLAHHDWRQWSFRRARLMVYLNSNVTNFKRARVGGYLQEE